MPLPSNGILSLQGHVGPGGADASKPKQAMIVRMSAETFEALEAQPNPPKVEIEFGTNPGLYVGEKFFSMRPHTENSPHELYMRSVPPSNKNTAPLRFYANVVGKFMVERELGSRVESVIRDKTAAAEKQRTERKTIMLDAPPPSAPPVKASKKKNTTTKKQNAVTSSRTMSTASSAQASRMVSPRPPPMPAPSPRSAAPSIASDSDRARLIHFLALNPRTLTEVMRSVGGIEEDQPFRQDLIDLLKAVAQPGVKPTATGAGPQKWLLKIKSWLEVKPFTYPNLSNQERLKLSEKAGSAYKKMDIPTSDPKWDDIRPPGGMSGTTSRIPSGSRPAVSQEAKAKQANPEISVKPKVPASDLPSKSERLKIPKYEEEEDSIPGGTTSKALPRRLPGSGFKMKTGSNTPPTPDLPSSRSESRKPEARPVKIEKISHHSASLPPPPPREARPAMNSNPSATRISQNGRETREFARPADPVRERPRESPAPGSSLKRKKATRDEQETEFSERESLSGMKKRKVEEPAPERRKERDLSLPKKPVIREPSPPARYKSSKYDGRSPLIPPSPLAPASSPRIPPRQPQHDRAPSLSSNRSRDDTSHRSSSARPRRKSPIYTSSEEEDDRPRRHTDASRRDRDDHRHDKPLSSAPATTVSFKKHSSAHNLLSLPDSPEVLKKIYNRRWLIYSSLRARHAALVEEIRELLRDGGDEVFLPDGDPGLPNPDELVKLREDLDREEKTLHAIMDKWEGMRKQGKTAEGPLVPRPSEA
ncbi:hypothetical protein BDY19DRAFT_967795 [Irpex rosettiformis]|uniref:Uncharacterized protein n=1 Tax=Irpex rosettiformis TaxID=378272 RepID=A0ACB8TSN5_9APHY|nr:hypothetical protein BDY19DRAFT_967795 [Irpex rosettiformis]